MFDRIPGMEAALDSVSDDHRRTLPTTLCQLLHSMKEHGAPSAVREQLLRFVDSGCDSLQILQERKFTLTQRDLEHAPGLRRVCATDRDLAAGQAFGHIDATEFLSALMCKLLPTPEPERIAVWLHPDGDSAVVSEWISHAALKILSVHTCVPQEWHLRSLFTVRLLLTLHALQLR